jgi:23S rRNA (adenine2503-C2)-methyltransferase
VKRNIRDLTLEELRAELESMGEPRYRAAQVFGWLYRKDAPAADFERFTDIPAGLRRGLAERFTLGLPEVVDRVSSSDGTTKFLFRLEDGALVESVLIPAGRRLTVCLSTQAGCRFGCAFCASGRMGFRRNLRPSEITGQFLAAEKPAGRELSNYVFMGMGEPLDNYDNLERTLRIMNSPEGLNIAARRMTVSTAGLVPGIERFKGLGLQVNLSISLHAVTDRLRGELMPVNRRYPLAELMRAAEEYVASGGRMITFEYIVFKGLNDTLADADGLAAMARKLRAKVNLIPASPVPGLDFKTPSTAEVERFRAWLEERRVRVTVRQSKGRDIAAACGQLAGGTAAAASGATAGPKAAKRGARK